MDREATLRELNELRPRVERLEAELAGVGVPFRPPAYYAVYHVMSGCVLGMFAAATSLLFNIVGSLLVGQHPLEFIRVYLTFPLAAAALKTDDGLTLAIGCCLYLGTGMILGVPFQLVLTRFFRTASFGLRFVVVSLLAISLWLLNYYAILYWLQPQLFGGRWIVDLIPWWVAAATHLVFGWTILLAQPLSNYVPYPQPGEEA